MNPRRIAALPVDARPAVREQVQMLAALGGWDLRMPAAAQLGHLRQGADRAGLAAWLEAEAAQAEGFVISLDMLAYGGLVPSRFIDDPLEDLAGYMALLPRLKAAWPDKPLYVFAATMRISNNNVNEEEKTYWSEHGAAIWRWSWLTDARDPQAAAAAEAIPAHIRADYLATRERNFALTLRALDLAATGVIDRLVLPQDDTAQYGFNIAERRRLEQQIAARGLQERVLVYPGADEVIHTLCAHMAGRLQHAAPLRFHLRCSDPENVSGLRALYEDRPVLDSLASQVHAAGGILVGQADEADVILGLHSCGKAQGDWAMQAPLPQPKAVSPDWLAFMARCHAQGKPVAIADLAYANGGDPAMMGALAGAMPLAGLAAYAGWNTASNSIGSLVAQCVFAQGRYDSPGNRQVLALRLLEDLLYQAVVRQAVRLGARDDAFTADALRERVDQIFTAHANAWAAGHALGWEVARVDLPWDRTFEIGLTLRPAGGTQ